MKKLGLFIFGTLTIGTLACGAQGTVLTNGGWHSIGDYDLLGSDYTNNDDGETVQVEANLLAQTPPTPPVIAEVITPEIQALADGLQDDPVKILNYVHDHIRYVLYFGAKKGANLTLLEKSGNDFDQSALLVAMLRAAGYTNASYQFGWQVFPFDNPDGSHRDLHHWLGLNFTNNTWSSTLGYLQSLFGFWRGYPLNSLSIGGTVGDNNFAFQRVWVLLPIGGTNYLLDPAFKVTEQIAGISLSSAIGSPSSISNAFMSLALGTEFGSPSGNFYVTNLNESGIDRVLAGYTTNLLGYIQKFYPNASVEQIMSGQYIVPSTNTSLSQNLLFAATNMNGTMPVINWVNEPTDLMATLKINFGGKSYQWFMPQLEGQRIALVYGSSSVKLWQDDTNIASGSFSGSDSVTLSAHHFHQDHWDTTNNVFLSNGGYTAAHTTTYHANSDYAIMYSFEPDWGWLQKRQRQLDIYRQQGLANTSRQVTDETLNIMGLNWALQTEYLSQMLARQTGVLPMTYQKIGRMAQENGSGYYVDAYLYTEGSANNVGFPCDQSCDINHGRWFDLWAYFSSAMEHGMIEQLQTSNLVAASTVKMLEIANASHQAIYLANSTNWSVVQTQLTNYTIVNLTILINGGNQLLLPQNGNTAINGSGSWAGHGFMQRLSDGTATGMIIGYGIFGGYVSDLDASIDTSWINYSAYSQPIYFSSSPVSIPNITGADPVNMADGTFQVQSDDLSLGEQEPRGLSFSRYYNSSRRASNLQGISPGWLHNYYLNAATISSPQAGLGGTTPAQAASMLVAITAANAVYDKTPDPKNWLITALISKWGIDQLTANAVSISLGKDTVQFIKQPDGSYTPPANSTMNLLRTNGVYWLQERHGRTFKFNAAGWGTSIVDQYNQSLQLAYNSSNWVTTATDWKGRALTFNYTGTNPKRLTSVSDNTGRSVGLGYSTSGDLNSVIDPETKTNTFNYDTNHQIVASFNARHQLVASNIFNGFGRVTSQLTQGDTNKTWKIFWSGWQTVSQDPAGGKQTYVYDDKTRLIGQQDALGHLTQRFYDGQDHVVMTVSPLGEINQFSYDGNNNLVQTVDPLGFSNQFVYDNNNSLTTVLDARTYPQTYGYNAQFSLTGSTNGAGDFVSYVYDPTDGTLTSRTDAGGTQTYHYDTYGQLSTVTYGSLGDESFANNALGDVTNYIDPRGFATGFQYNLRRQLTKSTGPTNLVTSVAYDGDGNVMSTVDARGAITTNLWSATGKLVRTKFPVMPAGMPMVTNAYDKRDWLIQTLDPLQKLTQFTNDLAGHLVAATDPLLQTVTIVYDADGHTIATTNAAHEPTTQSWDIRGKLAKLTDGEGHSVSHGYDGAGNQIFLTNRNSQVWQFQFDGANRLTNMTSPLSHSTTLAFNHQGLPASTTDAAGQTNAYNYDAKGRLINRVDSLGTTTYIPDASDNILSVDEHGLTNYWTYDAYNRPSTCIDVFGNLIQYRYDANGNVINLIYPNGKSVSYAFDSNNHLTNVTDWAGRKTAIGYDLAGHLTSLKRPNGTQRVIGYDAAGQTTNILETMTNDLPIAWFKFGWDAAARPQWEFSTPLPHVATVETRTMTYDNDNRLATFDSTSVSNDLDGNLISGPLTNSTFTTYVFDARSRLSNVGGVANAYDPLGDRVGLTYGTNSESYVVNPNTKLPQVLVRVKNGVTTYYVYGVGLLYEITEIGTNEQTRSYTYDYRGSTVALTDDSGHVTDRIEYSTYGLTTYRVGTTDTPFLFNGKYGVQTDPNGLLFMQARFYNPYLCRFINPDPSGFSGGLNFYAYANGNPVTLVDPFGLGAVSDAVAAAAWCNAPTPEQTEVENFLADTLNFVTLGAANLVSSAVSGKDLTGNNLDLADAFEQTLQSGASAASLLLALPTDGGSMEVEAESGIWNLSPTARGRAIEQNLGANLPSNFPVIDQFTSGTATSIKSIDLTATSYQNTAVLGRKLNGYVDSVAGFNGANLSGAKINASQITARQLQLAIPQGSASAAQRAVINAAAKRAQGMGVKFIVTPIR